jgi:4-hydroxymandelate oxidase
MAIDFVNLFEIEKRAKDRLPRAVYDFIAGGATDEVTLRRTRAVYEALLLRPRMFGGAAMPQLGTTVLGQPIALPVLAAPAGSHGAAHPDAEFATAAACAEVGTIMAVSSGSTFSLEEISASAAGPLWFQQYLFRDSSVTLEFADRAARAGYRAICVTVDSAITPKRERNIRNPIPFQPPVNYLNVKLDDLQSSGKADAAPGVLKLIDRASPEALAELAAHTELPIVVKGVLTAEDAKVAVANGASALVVSDHGGRQLDTTVASIEALPEIVAAAGDAEVYLDGGIRRGGDIVKALSLGARAVLIGRPIFWGLAVDGAAGVRAVFELLREELTLELAMCGVESVAAVPRSLVALRSPLESALL